MTLLRLPSFTVLLLLLFIDFENSAAQSQQKPGRSDQGSEKKFETVLLTASQLDSWKRLLLFGSSLFSYSSLVEPSEYFLSSSGHENPKAELEEFLVQLKAKPSSAESKKLSCRFPARAQFVRQNFRSLRNLPSLNVECPKLEEWLNNSGAEGVSLIFTAHYPNNPASMMGHTFLRVHKRKDKKFPLLDQAISFAANADFSSPLSYTWKGLTGGFMGSFSMGPYYSKVSFYGNVESRDIWEYDLNLDKSQITMMLLVLWEIAPHPIRYYYTNVNCSSVLLYLLGAAIDKKWADPLAEYDFFVHPSDTIRKILEVNSALVKDIAYRPSIKSRYKSSLQTLEGTELKLLRAAQDLVDRPLNQKIQENRGLLDTLALWTELRALETTEKADITLKKKRIEVLKARAALPNSDSLKDTAESTKAKRKDNLVSPLYKPHNTHYGSSIEFSIGDAKEAGGFTELTLRPSFHGFLESSSYTSANLNIELAKLSLRANKSNPIFLEEFKLLELLSINSSELSSFSSAWNLSLSWKNHQNALNYSNSTILGGGYGMSYQLNEVIFAYLIPSLSVFAQTDSSLNLAPSIHMGIFTVLSSHWSFGSTGKRYLATNQAKLSNIQAKLSYTKNKDTIVFVSWDNWFFVKNQDIRIGLQKFM